MKQYANSCLKNVIFRLSVDLDWLNGSVDRWTGQQIGRQINNVTGGTLDLQICIWHTASVDVCSAKDPG